MVQRAREGAAAAIHGLANAIVSADLLTHAETLTEVSLATRTLKTRCAALHAEVTSSTATIDQRAGAVALACDLRIAALASVRIAKIPAEIRRLGIPVPDYPPRPTGSQRTH